MEKDLCQQIGDPGAKLGSCAALSGRAVDTRAGHLGVSEMAQRGLGRREWHLTDPLPWRLQGASLHPGRYPLLEQALQSRRDGATGQGERLGAKLLIPGRLLQIQPRRLQPLAAGVQRFFTARFRARSMVRGCSLTSKRSSTRLASSTARSDGGFCRKKSRISVVSL
jgi:hypothetical protein